MFLGDRMMLHTSHRLKVLKLAVNWASCRVFKWIHILGIETSCDDTGAAVVTDKGEIVGECLNSQLATHISFGGILPTVAKLLHEENIESVVKTCMKTSGLKLNELTAVATTVKPGLALSLDIGVKFGKLVASTYDLPFIPIHHMEAHALTIRMVENVSFPFMVLLVSGGHSILAVAEDVDKFLLLGNTLDDAPGEAFDKIARRMKLHNMAEFSKMSGGQAIEKLAVRGDPNRYPFSLPLSQMKTCNFSFAGLKNNATKYIIREEKLNGVTGGGLIPDLADLCASFQYAIAKHLARQTQRAMEFVAIKGLIPENKKTLVVSGGVACNKYIAQVMRYLCQECDYDLHIPPPHLCTDNGVMIAWNGVEKWLLSRPLETNLDAIKIQPKAPLGESLADEVDSMKLSCNWVKIPASY